MGPNAGKGGLSYVYLIAKSGERLIVETRDSLELASGAKIAVLGDAVAAMFFDNQTDARNG